MSALSVFADIIIIAICFGVAAYCRLLHKRLEQLRDVDTGLGAVIGRLNSGVNDMQQSFETTKQVVKKQSENLRDTIDEGTSLADYLNSLMKRANVLRDNITELTPHLQTTVDTLKSSKNTRDTSLRATRTPTPSLNDPNTSDDPLSDVEPFGFEELFKKRAKANT